MPLFHHQVSGTSPGESWSFGLYTSGSGTLTSAQATWLASFDDFWTGNFDAVVTADISAIELTTASVEESTGGQISRLGDDVTLPGVATGEMIPFQCATCVTLTTALATRGGRGRFYLPPLAVSTLDAGRVSTGAVATIVGAAGALWAGLDTGGLELVLYSRTTKATTTVTGGNVGNVIDTQRRRRNKLIEARVGLTAP